MYAIQWNVNAWNSWNAECMEFSKCHCMEFSEMGNVCNSLNDQHMQFSEIPMYAIQWNA